MRLNPIPVATFGRVEGSVLDVDGAPIAHVKLHIMLGNEVCFAETNYAGVFAFLGLPPRPTYTVCILGELSTCAFVNGPNAAPLRVMAMGPRAVVK